MRNFMNLILMLILVLCVACAGEDGESPVTQVVTDNGILVTGQDVSVTVTPADSEAGDSVAEAIEMCCPYRPGLADDDCIISNFPELPDDLCRRNDPESDEEVFLNVLRSETGYTLSW